MDKIFEAEPPKLTTGLNVLTILTFIGCAIQLLFGLFGFVSAKKSYEMREETLKQMQSEDIPAVFKNMMGTPEEFIEMVTKSFENRLPILLVSLVAITLCFIGALQMRKLKKQGYTLYLVGQILPYISVIAFLGAVAFSGFIWFSVFISLLFILLYTLQRKNLVY